MVSLKRNFNNFFFDILGHNLNIGDQEKLYTKPKKKKKKRKRKKDFSDLTVDMVYNRTLWGCLMHVADRTY